MLLERLTQLRFEGCKRIYASQPYVPRPVSKELWQQLQPLIPPFIASRKVAAAGTISDEAAFNGILFVLRTGIPWEDLPQALGYGSGMTCWRRLRQWSETGVWEQLHQAMLVPA